MSANSGENVLYLDVPSSVRSPKAVLLLALSSASEMNLSTEAVLELFRASHVLFADVEILCIVNNMGAPINPSTSLAAGSGWSKEKAELLAHLLAVKNGHSTDEWLDLEYICGRCGRLMLSFTQMWLIQVLPVGVDLLFFNLIACDVR